MLHMFKIAQDLAVQLEKESGEIEKCTFKFDKGSGGSDTAQMLVCIKKKPAFFNLPLLGYFPKPNTVDFNYKI